jgi:hypothetical protein
VEKGKKETKPVRDRKNPQSPPPEQEPAREPQQFTDSGLTGQGAQSALDHLVRRERSRADGTGAAPD